MHVERNCPFRGYVSWGPPLENQRLKLKACPDTAASRAARVFSGAGNAGTQAAFDHARVAVRVHSLDHGLGDSSGSGCFCEQSIEREITFAPAKDAVGESVCGGCESSLAIKASLLCGTSKCVKRVIAMAARVRHAEYVELALGNLKDGTDPGE